MKTLKAEAKRAATEYAEAHALSSIEIAWYNGAQWMAKRVAEEPEQHVCLHHERILCDDGDCRHICHKYDKPVNQKLDAPTPPEGYDLLPKGDGHTVQEGELKWFPRAWCESTCVGHRANQVLYYCRPVKSAHKEEER